MAHYMVVSDLYQRGFNDKHVTEYDDFSVGMRKLFNDYQMRSDLNKHSASTRCSA